MAEQESETSMDTTGDQLTSTSHRTSEPPPECTNSENTRVSTEESLLGKNDDDDGRRIIANGIASVLDPVMRDFDSSVEGAIKSQDVLKSSIDRLTRELDKLLEDAPFPFATQNATRLLGIRRRVANLNSTLQVIQRRIDNIERMLSGFNACGGNGLHREETSMSEGYDQHVKACDSRPLKVSDS